MSQNQKRHGYIYLHHFPNGKNYVGQTFVSPEHRWGKDGAGYSQQEAIWNAIQYYGWNNIEHRILEEGEWTQEEIDDKEKYWIDQYHSFGPQGYNLNPGGNCVSPTKEIYQIDRETWKIIAQYPSLTEAAIAVKGSPECISQCCSRALATANGFCWCYVEDYTPSWEPNGDSLRKGRKVYCVETGVVYASGKEVAQAFGVTSNQICRICNVVHEFITLGRLSEETLKRHPSYQYHGLHFCYYTDKDLYQEVPKISFSNKILCQTTGEIFASIREAARKYDIPYDWFKRKLRRAKGEPIVFQDKWWVVIEKAQRKRKKVK